MEDKASLQNKKLLLMGSSAFKDRELPVEVKERMDKTMERGIKIIVGEALEARTGFIRTT